MCFRHIVQRFHFCPFEDVVASPVKARVLVSLRRMLLAMLLISRSEMRHCCALGRPALHRRMRRADDERALFFYFGSSQM